MTNWKSQSIRLRLEYAIKREGEAGVEFEPYEVALELPVAKILVTDRLDNVPGKAILGLQPMGTDDSYALFRLKDDVSFAFDDDDKLESLHGVLKVNFTNADQDTGATIVNTACYPISPEDDNLEDTEALPLVGIDWKLLLKREDVDTDPSASVYRLIHVKPEGGGVAPICEDLNCKETTDPATQLKCTLEGCYD